MDSIENETQSPDVSSDDTQKAQQDTKKKKRLNWPVIILSVLVVALLGYVGYTFYKNNYASEVATQASATPVSLVSNSNQSATAAVEKIVDSGVTWQEAKKLDDLQLFKKQEGDCEMMGDCEITVEYFNVGKLSSGEEIITAFVSYAVSTVDVFRFTKKDSAYKLVQQNSDEADGTVYYIDSDKVSYDTTTVFKSLLTDKVIDSGSTRLTYRFNGDSGADEDFTSEKSVSDTKWGKLYLQHGSKVTADNDSVKVGRYYLKLNDGTKAYYEMSPIFFRDDGTLDISWQNSSDSSREFQKFATGGCGGSYGSFPIVTDQTLVTGKKEIGANAAGSKVYAPATVENSLVDFGYDMYEQYNEGDKDSRETYYSNNGIIIWVDDYGSIIVYSNKKYAPQVECGKPVVYLYPQESTKVTVKVGANVTKSDPTYNNGWTAIANPDGKLEIGQMVFPYLYWEGEGLGKYPVVKSAKVVARSDVEKTVKEDLAYIGLNAQEIKDFNEFWIPKMPDSPYVRMTWFQNDELDKLAPLAITPKPQSTIRVFLDYQPTSKSETEYPSQKLKQYQRNGFTAVEWGGLLRSGN